MAEKPARRSKKVKADEPTKPIEASTPVHATDEEKMLAIISAQFNEIKKDNLNTQKVITDFIEKMEVYLLGMGSKTVVTTVKTPEQAHLKSIMSLHKHLFTIKDNPFVVTYKTYTEEFVNKIMSEHMVELDKHKNNLVAYTSKVQALIWKGLTKEQKEAVKTVLKAKQDDVNRKIKEDEPLAVADVSDDEKKE